MTGNGKTLFISDLDGTLLNAESKLSDVTVEMVNHAISLGADFSVATARTPATVSLLLSRLKLRLPLAVMTGAVLWNPVTNQYSEPKFINEESVRTLIEIYRKADLPVFVFTLREDHVLHIYHLGELSAIERQFIAERKDSPYKNFHVPESGRSDLPARLDNVLLFYSTRPTEPARRVYEEVRRVEGINPLFYHDIYGPEIAVLEIFSPEASKARAARRIAGMAGDTRITAFGDNCNDLPLLKAADTAVAVENAIEDVRGQADTVIGRNVEDSVARYILEHTIRNSQQE